MDFAGCTFSGNYDGAPLVRTGSFAPWDYPARETEKLDLSWRGITSVPANAFEGFSITLQ
jgi:hypothetical protein